MQRLDHFLDRFLAEVRDRVQLGAGLPHQVADGLDPGPLEAVVGADSELELLDQDLVEPVAGGGAIARGGGEAVARGDRDRLARGQLLDPLGVGEDRQRLDQDLGGLAQCCRRLDRAVGLEVETDGSIEPGAALREAAEILIKSLAIFTTADRVDELRGEGAIAVTDGAGGGEAAAVPGADGLDEILIEELELGVRSYNCLKRAGIQTVGELVRKSESELNAIPNFGRKSIEEVQETLRARGLSLRQD